MSYLELLFESNIFDNNKAVNGGALFFSIDKMNYLWNTNHQKTIIRNNIFNENSAKEFGGAIYTEFTKFNKTHYNTFENNTLSYNTAGVMGGGLYSSQITNITSLKPEEWNFIHNTVNLHLNEYTTKPSYLTLDTPFNKKVVLITGDVLPINFTLYDSYNNVVQDITKYYSSMTLRITLEKINNLNDKKEKNYKLLENTRQLLNGNI